MTTAHLLSHKWGHVERDQYSHRFQGARTRVRDHRPGAPARRPRRCRGLGNVLPDHPSGIFERDGQRLFTLAFRMLAAHAEASDALRGPAVLGQLTSREVQCLRWLAAGKTNAEIGILSLSLSTVRFHQRNAGIKLRTANRS